MQVKRKLYAQPYGLVIIMTTVYFAKRCKSDRKVIDEQNRPFTDEGVSDLYKVMEILKDKKNRCIYF